MGEVPGEQPAPGSASDAVDGGGGRATKSGGDPTGCESMDGDEADYLPENMAVPLHPAHTHHCGMTSIADYELLREVAASRGSLEVGRTGWIYL